MKKSNTLWRTNSTRWCMHSRNRKLENREKPIWKWHKNTLAWEMEVNWVKVFHIPKVMKESQTVLFSLHGPYSRLWLLLSVDSTNRLASCLSLLPTLWATCPSKRPSSKTCTGSHSLEQQSSMAPLEQCISESGCCPTIESHGALISLAYNWLRTPGREAQESALKCPGDAYTQSGLKNISQEKISLNAVLDDEVQLSLISCPLTRIPYDAWFQSSKTTSC